MERRNLAYWLTTGIFCLALGVSGATYLFRMESMVEGMSMLGYPVYLMTIIGTFKLLGIAALLAPRTPLLKEWAYAGFTFNLIGATASHLYVGDPISDWIKPLVVLGSAPPPICSGPIRGDYPTVSLLRLRLPAMRVPLLFRLRSQSPDRREISCTADK